MSPDKFLNTHLSIAEDLLKNKQFPTFSIDTTKALDEILSRSESSKGVLTVVLTSLVYKLLNPEQDIRLHQSSINGGYSGRTFDTRYITPFLKHNKFPAMAESGWLTRSLEQKVAYDNNYTGAIRPKELKEAFLFIINIIEEKLSSNEQIAMLHYILAKLIEQREQNQITLATPGNLNISQILELLKAHFTHSYKFEGASRLPVLAIYAIYQILLKEVSRFSSHTLLPLESHTSSDMQTGRLGDIDILDKDRRPFEAVEVKHLIPIDLSHIETAYSKFMSTNVKRYYILSTSDSYSSPKGSILKRIQDIKNTHGCQIIANGIYSTLLYYLRLIEDPSQFLKKYTDLLKVDNSIKYEHRQAWNDIVEELLRGTLVV